VGGGQPVIGLDHPKDLSISRMLFVIRCQSKKKLGVEFKIIYGDTKFGELKFKGGGSGSCHYVPIDIAEQGSRMCTSVSLQPPEPHTFE